jgi:hypothetical protein
METHLHQQRYLNLYVYLLHPTYSINCSPIPTHKHEIVDGIKGGDYFNVITQASQHRWPIKRNYFLLLNLLEDTVLKLHLQAQADFHTVDRYISSKILHTGHFTAVGGDSLK